MNIFKKLFTIFCYINSNSQSNAYINTPHMYKSNTINKITNQDNIKMIDFNEIYNCLNNNIDIFLDLEIKEKYLGRIIVEQLSSALPHVDSIGHNILHANNEFINFILNDSPLTEKMKKDIILFSIRLAQYGDDAGSHLLQLYYNIVDKCL